MDYPIGYAQDVLAFVTTGALLGVKIFRRNAEHVVTLDAHAMKHRLSRRRRFVLRVVRLVRLRRGLRSRLGGFGRHTQILAYRLAVPHLSKMCALGARHPQKMERHLIWLSRSRSKRRGPVVYRLKLVRMPSFNPPVKAGRARTE